MSETPTDLLPADSGSGAKANRRSTRISTCQNGNCSTSGWLRCTDCRVTFYCSHKCKNEHAEAHRPTCEALAAEIATREPKSVPSATMNDLVIADSSFLSPSSFTPTKTSDSSVGSVFSTPNVLNLADALKTDSSIPSTPEISGVSYTLNQSPNPNANRENSINNEKASNKSALEESLEEQLREKDLIIARLEKEKANLDAFVRKTLLAFKDKCVTAVTAARNEKQALEDQNKKLLEILEAHQAASKSQDGLLMSTIYELGLKIVERSIQEGKKQQPSQSSNLDNGDK